MRSTVRVRTRLPDAGARTATKTWARRCGAQVRRLRADPLAEPELSEGIIWPPVVFLLAPRKESVPHTGTAVDGNDGSSDVAGLR